MCTAEDVLTRTEPYLADHHSGGCLLGIGGVTDTPVAAEDIARA